MESSVFFHGGRALHHPFITQILGQGKYEEADRLYKDALAIDEKVLGPDHPHVARDFNNRARLMETQVSVEFDILERNTSMRKY